MYPEDRVLVVYVPSPRDFAIIRTEGWYRIPVARAPKGLLAEAYAFYFGSQFGARRWAIHAWAPRLGHELTRRVDLLPAEADHARAEGLYYRIQLGEIQWLARPIVSLRWRRLAFVHTTWDRFESATEIGDLVRRGPTLVDREFAALR